MRQRNIFLFQPSLIGGTRSRRRRWRDLLPLRWCRARPGAQALVRPIEVRALQALCGRKRCDRGVLHSIRHHRFAIPSG
jgi:hypothetical protein